MDHQVAWQVAALVRASTTVVRRHASGVSERVAAADVHACDAAKIHRHPSGTRSPRLRPHRAAGAPGPRRTRPRVPACLLGAASQPSVPVTTVPRRAREGAIHPEPDPSLGIGLAAGRRASASRAARRSSSPAPVSPETLTAGIPASVVVGEHLARLIDRGRRICEVAPGHRHQAMADAEACRAP